MIKLKTVTCVLCVWLLARTTALSTIKSIQVCQNKDCCSRFQGRASNLVQTLRQITSQVGVPIESTGCLSHCDKGPNIRIVISNGKEVIEHGVDSAHAAAAVLELADPNLRIHPTLLAAWKVMEQSQQAPDASEKERFLNSVINALSKDESLAVSTCMAQALVLRSQVLSNDDDINNNASKITERLDSARTDIIRAAVLDPYHPTVWRILATIEEERNDHAAAIQALSKWATYQPLFSTKVQNEISRLRDSTAR
ncbi:hypothetical protein MHU86_2437 [Fragilaria crotonensis]|nr:hypothetical protein MHU86_2437 [Fragilaria crotonensis]